MNGPRRFRRSIPAIALVAGLAVGAADAAAQSQPPDLSALLDGAPAVGGTISFSGARVYRWSEAGTQRLLLIGHVRMSLGGHTFSAERACAWVRTVSLGSQPRTQVYVHLENVGDAAEPAGEGIASSGALAVRGVFASELPVSLAADLLLDGPPGANAPAAERACLVAATASLESTISRKAGTPGPEALPPLPTFTPSGRVAARTTSTRPVIAWPGVVLNPPSTREAKHPTQPSPGDPTPLRPFPPRADTTPAPPAPTKPTPSGPTQPTPVAGPTTPGPSPSGPATNPGAPTGPTRATGPATAPSGAPAAATHGEPIFATSGIVSISPRNFSLVSGEDESAITAWGGVAVQYFDVASGKNLQLSAQRAVVFLDPGRPEDMNGLKASSIRGIYLEGDVTATDGTYTLRGPQIYYDFRENRAVMPDAVFWTYDEQRQLPVYVRAKAIRQTAASSFEGQEAVLTNSAFFHPELSIGASTITISRKERIVKEADAKTGTPAQTTSALWVDARNITGRIAGLPVTYWPRYAGDPEERIVKDIRVENRSGSGGALLTTLNAYALLGLETPRNFSLDVLADLYFERGPGLGARANWGDEHQSGSVFAYTVPFDRGVDVFKSGARTNRNDEFRGVLFGEQRWRIDDEWTAFGELALLSDPAVVDAFFEELGETRREFTNRLAIRRLRDNTYFGAEVSGTLADFISNEYLLESQGYSVTRTPEGTYIRLADDLLPETAPGVLSYFSEYRAGRVEMAMDEATAREHGLFFTSTSVPGLGINPDDSLSQALRTAGLVERTITRADTRHELTAQLHAGPVIINPFIVGRATFWDSSFPEFSPDEDAQWRLWGAAGVRLSTTFQHIDDAAESALLDIHRLRHVVEPNATFWVAGTTLERFDLPVYDQDVEDLPHGASARVGVTQRLQTQRGGPGRWHNTDLLTLSTDLVLTSDEAGHRGPYGRYIDFRPELSNPGDYAVADLALRLTDATSFTTSSTYDLDANQQAATSVGLLFRQYPDFWASVDLRFLNPQDSTYLTIGLGYELTSKYAVGFGAAYDTDESRFQYASIELRRRFQSTILGLGLTINEITGETSIGVVFRPYGASGEVGLNSLGSRVGGY